MARCTVQTGCPDGVSSSIELPLISETSRPPFWSGVSPFGDPSPVGGSCTQRPGVPIWWTTRLVRGSRMENAAVLARRRHSWISVAEEIGVVRRGSGSPARFPGARGARTWDRMRPDG